MKGPRTEIISGQRVTVIYINNAWEPVEPEDATMVKITFPDGNVRFGVKNGTKATAGAEARGLQDGRGLRRGAGRVEQPVRATQGTREVSEADMNRGRRLRVRAADGSQSHVPVVHAEFVEAFDPNQPRDESGKWTDTGGEKGGGAVAEPSRPLRQVAKKYARRAGIYYKPPAARSTVNVKRAARIANEYDRMKHDPHDPEVKAAYGALINETMAQFQAIKATGLKMEPYPEKGDPYKDGPRAVINDVRDNNHLYFFPTAQGFGSDASFDASENPLLAKTDEKIGDYSLLANDVFRLVHDYFGHVKEGNGFRADGEENAWRSHSRMYSKQARRAMTTETRGQNSWVNFGPKGAQNRKAKSAGETVFPDQKVGLLPVWASEEGV